MLVAFIHLFSNWISKAALMKFHIGKNVENMFLGYGLFLFHSLPTKLFVNLSYLWASVLILLLSFILRCWQATLISLLREPFLLLHRYAAARWARLCRNHPSSFLEGGFYLWKQLQVLLVSPGTWRFLTACFAAWIPELLAGSWRGSRFPLQASKPINQCLLTQQYLPQHIG